MRNENKPLVSVIIPTYKRKSITRAIESVLIQNYPNIDIWVIDDNAENPEYRGYIKEVAKTYKNICNIHFVFNDVNLGGALSRNVGIKSSTGEFVAFLDDDDWYLQDKIAKQVEYLCSKPEFSIVYCWCRGENADGTVIWENRKCKEGRLLFEAMTECIANTSLIMCRRKALERVGMFEDMPCKQDVYLELKLAVAGYSFACVPEVLVVYGDAQADYQCISKISPRTLEGFRKVRETARESYNQLTKKQVRMVETDTAYKMCQVTKKIRDWQTYRAEMVLALKNLRNVRKIIRITLDAILWRKGGQGWNL